ncbi:SDR family NAD(P)-dependent oxidoreductase [Bradyrhizobium sp. CCGUVB23]|uniref:SDR family NAD(P)-dependent oxidoreductase n=1 Tax=Bradyrhizobium sp. CCGUVB23 TaxID=2949630 RepID=UPI0020B45D91|nr:glucose 1-dehydrogenase [Bradyrhizobium sp. CCGUVB23]MCP3462904.1 glucose 1-dehydrogenase [Bradyrhizobium sp. CCGUVB23]
MPKLQGEVAVVTGGSSGIGLATAHRFVKEGAYVYITGRRQSELKQAVHLIGHDVTAVPGDVQSLDDLTRLYARIGKEKGGIDVLVANSGFIAPERLVDVTEANFDKTFGINVRGLLLTVRKALSLIRNDGSIIVISSIAAFKGIPGYTAYSATKASVRSFVRTWTAELRDRGIRVNAISPGPVDTPIIDSQAATKEGADAIRANFIRAVPLNRLENPEEIAAAALFLASDESSYVAGIDLVVDGGMSAL